MPALLTAFFLAWAACAAHADSGYVVRAASGTVYLDLLAGDGAAVGRRFTIYVEGEELKHPVTGKSLGRIEQKLAGGEIREVTPQYSRGILDDAASAVAAGQRARIDTPAAPPAGVAPAAAPIPAAPGSRRPAWRSPNARMEAVDLDVADVDGDGKKDFVLADANRVQVYPADPTGKTWEPFCSYTMNTTGTKFLSVEAMDLNGDGRVEIFVTYHNEFFGRVETAVLDCKDGKLQPLSTLPWMVRATFDAAGKRSLNAQTLLPDRSFPFGSIYPLLYADGKYQLGPKPLRSKRIEWIYSFALTGEEGGDAPLSIFYGPNGYLRAQYVKDHWTSPEPMGQTSNRVRWHDRLLRFSPRIPTLSENGRLAAVYAVRNIPRLGGLAEAFGIYGRGEIQRLHWSGTGLDTDWTGEADGYVAGITVADAVYAAVVGANGSTAVLKYTP